MSTLLIRNGRVIDPASGHDGVTDVLIEAGRIAAIGPGLSGATVFDATGLIVAPGFIDMHVHLREPGFERSETIESGAAAAAAGGFTSVACMPNTSPVNDSAEVTRFIVEQARQALVNVFPIGAISRGSAGEELADIAAMKEAGAVAISDDGRPVMNARLMRRAMETAKAYGLPVINHCEDLHLSAGGDIHEGAASVKLGLRGIPAAAEDVMVARDLLLAEVTGARYHVAHLSTKNAVAMVAYAKGRGLPVTCEVCPHHFALSTEEMTPYDSHFRMKPPLRSPEDVKACLDGIASGAVDVLATDHAPHPADEKAREFERCPFGITGLETAIGLSLEHLVHPGRISLRRMIELYTTGPAAVLQIPKGSLTPGQAADLTILDIERLWTYDVSRTRSKSRNSPFHGHRFRGGPVATIVAGQIVWRQN